MTQSTMRLALGLALITGASAQQGIGKLYEGNLVGGTLPAIDIINAWTGLGHDSCIGVARTPDGHYFVSTRHTFISNFHRYYEIDSAGHFVATHLQPFAFIGDTNGLLDLAWDGDSGPNSKIWAGLTGNTVIPFEWQTGIFDESSAVTFANYDGRTVANLAIAQLAEGPTFISADSCPPSTANEVQTPGSPINYHLADGTVLQEITPDPTPPTLAPVIDCRPEIVPEGKYGAAYDALTDTVWWHVDSRQSNPNPNQSMTRFYATDSMGEPKGMIIQGDRSLGGVASGCEFYEDALGNGILVYLVGNDETRLGRGTRIVEMHGRFEYGSSCSGRIDFDGECFIGNSDWSVDLVDIPAESGSTALLWRGQAVSPPLIPAIPGISNCGINITLLSPVGSALILDQQASSSIPVPNTINLVGAEIAFQWLVPGTPIPLPLDLSNGGTIRIGTRF